MTTIRCPHCAAPNRLAAQVSETTMECAVCGRTFESKGRGSEPESTPRRVVADSKSVDLLNASSSFDPVDWSIGADDQRMEPFSIDGSGVSNLGGSPYESTSSATLGEMPTADKQVDIAGILGKDAAFQETDSLDSRLFAGGQDNTESALLRQRSPREDDSSWRVRNDRGVVYEMSSTREIRIWLHDRADWNKLRISKAGGPFMALDAYPELEHDPVDVELPSALDDGPGADPRFAALMVDSMAGGMEQSPNTPEAATFDGSFQDHLELDFASASALHRTGTSASAARPGQFASPAGQTSSAQGTRVIADLTFRVPFITTVIVLATVLVGTSAYRSRILEAAAGSEVVQTSADASTAQARNRLLESIEAVDNGNFTTAAQRLSTLAATSSEPEVFRYLAIALYKTNRNHEAKRALARYRALVKQRKKRP
ncbi:MAG: hypothetical protein VX589_10740 [Myxococcota bacterium]|nr:hypothetical protein [Myxococcota bacterium]